MNKFFKKIKEAYPKCVIHDDKNYLNFSIGASIVYQLRIQKDIVRIMAWNYPKKLKFGEAFKVIKNQKIEGKKVNSQYKILFEAGVRNPEIFTLRIEIPFKRSYLIKDEFIEEIIMACEQFHLRLMPLINAFQKNPVEKLSIIMADDQKTLINSKNKIEKYQDSDESTIQQKLINGVLKKYPNAIAKKIDKDNFLDIYMPSVNTSKGSHIYFNTAKNVIKVGFYVRDEIFINNVVRNAPENIEPASNGLRISGNPEFDNVKDALSAAFDFLVNMIIDKPENSIFTKNNIKEIKDTKTEPIEDVTTQFRDSFTDEEELANDVSSCLESYSEKGKIVVLEIKEKDLIKVTNNHDLLSKDLFTLNGVVGIKSWVPLSKLIGKEESDWVKNEFKEENPSSIVLLYCNSKYVYAYSVPKDEESDNSDEVDAVDSDHETVIETDDTDEDVDLDDIIKNLLSTWENKEEENDDEKDEDENDKDDTDISEEDVVVSEDSDFSLSIFDINEKSVIDKISNEVKKGKYLTNLLYINIKLDELGYAIDNHETYFFDSNVLISDRELEGFLVVNMDGFYSNCIDADEMNPIFSWSRVNDIEYSETKNGCSIDIISDEGTLTIKKVGSYSLKILYTFYENVWKEITENFKNEPFIEWGEVRDMGINEVGFSVFLDYYNFKVSDDTRNSEPEEDDNNLEINEKVKTRRPQNAFKDFIDDFNDAILAFKNNNLEAVAKYVQAGNPGLQFSNNNGVIDNFLIAMTSGGNLNQEKLNLYVSKGLDLDSTTSDDDSYTACHFAAWDGNKDVLKLLIDAGANPDVIGGDTMTALNLASTNGHFDCVKLLVSSGANLENRVRNNNQFHSDKGGTALRDAVINSFWELADYLVQSDASIEVLNEKCSNGEDFFTAVRRIYLSLDNKEYNLKKISELEKICSKYNFKLKLFNSIELSPYVNDEKFASIALAVILEIALDLAGGSKIVPASLYDADILSERYSGLIGVPTSVILCSGFLDNDVLTIDEFKSSYSKIINEVRDWFLNMSTSDIEFLIPSINACIKTIAKEWDDYMNIHGKTLCDSIKKLANEDGIANEKGKNLIQLILDGLTISEKDWESNEEDEEEEDDNKEEEVEYDEDEEEDEDDEDDGQH